MQDFYWSIPMYLGCVMAVCLGLIIVWGGTAIVVQMFVNPPFGY